MVTFVQGYGEVHDAQHVSFLGCGVAHQTVAAGFKGSDQAEVVVAFRGVVENLLPAAFKDLANIRIFGQLGLKTEKVDNALGFIDCQFFHTRDLFGRMDRILDDSRVAGIHPHPYRLENGRTEHLDIFLGIVPDQVPVVTCQVKIEQYRCNRKNNTEIQDHLGVQFFRHCDSFFEV